MEDFSGVERARPFKKRAVSAKNSGAAGQQGSGAVVILSEAKDLSFCLEFSQNS
jgi:hypothetical protein